MMISHQLFQIVLGQTPSIQVMIKKEPMIWVKIYGVLGFSKIFGASFINRTLRTLG